MKFYAVKNKNKSRSAAKKSQRKQISSRNMRLQVSNTPVSLRPDHTVVVKHIQRFSNVNLQNGFFDAYEVIQPHAVLDASSWGRLLRIYESVRVTRINLRCYLYGVSMSTPGVSCAMNFRDVVPTNPMRTFEQLAVEFGHKRGRPVTVFNFTWVPIEPSDYEFYDHSEFNQMDSGRYGQLNYAATGLPGTPPTPIIEYTIKYDFKHLVEPVQPPSRLFTPYQNNWNANPGFVFKPWVSIFAEPEVMDE